MYEQSHRDYLRSGYCIVWLYGLLIITVITPLPTKPARQKCQRTEAGERGTARHAGCQRDVAAPMQNTRRS